MNRNFDFVGLNSVISEGSKPLPKVTATLARKAGAEAATKGTSPRNCHYSYFATEALEKEWYCGYREAKQKS